MLNLARGAERSCATFRAVNNASLLDSASLRPVDQEFIQQLFSENGTASSAYRLLR
jgi:hypothetical protein